jgi:putative spermidine/putrescine transport system ATP-binding protein
LEGLKIQGLRLQRGSFQVSAEALSVSPGEVVALCGKSGCGKSSLLQAIAGFLPCEGEVWVQGVRVDRLPAEKRRIALVFQRPSLFPHLNVHENIAFGLRVQGVARNERERRVAQWLERIELSGLGKRFSNELSEGQAQRVALARAWAVGFPVVLMDEPFSALDEATKRPLGELVRSLAEETSAAVLLVSHDSREVERLAHRIVAQDQGVLASQ